MIEEIPTQKRLLNRRELGEAIGVHPRTILNYRKQGLPYIPISTKTVRYDLEEVVKWLKEKKGKNKIDGNGIW